MTVPIPGPLAIAPGRRPGVVPGALVRVPALGEQKWWLLGLVVALLATVPAWLP